MNTFKVFADYNQFYLLDGEVQPLYPEDVTDLDVERRLKAVPHLVAVYTSAPSEVSLPLEQLPCEPPLELAPWEHVAEAPLQLPSGRLVIAGCTDFLPECPEVRVTPGAYSVRVHRRMVEGSEEEYLALLWPSAMCDLRVLKPE